MTKAILKQAERISDQNRIIKQIDRDIIHNQTVRCKVIWGQRRGRGQSIRDPAQNTSLKTLTNPLMAISVIFRFYGFLVAGKY